MSTSTLYTLASQPASPTAFSNILALMDLSNSSLLLRQEACYLLADKQLVTCLTQHLELTSSNLYVLKDDAIARGILDVCANTRAKLIDYQKWVELTLSHQQVQAIR